MELRATGDRERGIVTPGRLVGVAVALLSMLLFWPAVDYGFLAFDDPLYVVENSQVRQGLTRDGWVWSFNVGYAGNWHPLTWLSLMLDVTLFGVDAGAHHRTSVLLHALNTGLLFAVLTALLRRARPGITDWPAAMACGFVTAVFAFHPQRLESVVWISERKDVLSGTFWLLTLLAYLKYTRLRSAGNYLIVTIAFVLGLMAKPMVVTLPLILLVLDFWPLGRIRRAGGGFRGVVLEKLPLLVLAAGSSALTVLAQRSGGAIGSLEAVPLTERLANAAVSYLAYIGDMLYPARLAVLYPLPLEGWPWWQVLAASLFLAGLTSLALLWIRFRPWLAAGWAWYVIALAPVIGLVQVGTQARADRYTYLPTIGLAVILTWASILALGRLPHRTWLLSSLGSIALLGLIVGTRTQLPAWSDGVRLFTRAVERTDANYAAHYALAVQHAVNGATARAIEHGEAAVAIHPGDYRARDHLGSCLVTAGRIDEGLAQIEYAIATNPDYAWAHFNLGTVYLNQKRAAAAVASLTRAVELDPGLAQAWTNLGLAYEATGRQSEALDALARAAERDPALFEARFALGRLHAERGEHVEAKLHLEGAAHLRPGDPAVHLTLGLIAIQRGDQVEARHRYRTLRSLDPQAAGRLLERLEVLQPGPEERAGDV